MEISQICAILYLVAVACSYVFTRKDEQLNWFTAILTAMLLPVLGGFFILLVAGIFIVFSKIVLIALGFN